MGKGKHSRLTWEDLYYDGLIDERYEIFDEESQKIFNVRVNDGWDHHLRDKKYIDECNCNDDHFIELKNMCEDSPYYRKPFDPKTDDVFVFINK
ncbi:hypothetical protein [Paenibacillus cremeus]|uniref:Uncharacterized protein n=1 Tax=Paenibacillus cremeus TaxID=2163881 RepID=A0A559KCV1_9BACL|nr:hypothetical protein [Paenibacillus cremeus]TVY09951.1 hypothetical protein FPZ49_11305 [Paenibacillus cremeus]